MDLYHAHLANIDPKWSMDGNATTTRGNRAGSAVPHRDELRPEPAADDRCVGDLPGAGPPD